MIIVWTNILGTRKGNTADICGHVVMSMKSDMVKSAIHFQSVSAVLLSLLTLEKGYRQWDLKLNEILFHFDPDSGSKTPIYVYL